MVIDRHCLTIGGTVKYITVFNLDRKSEANISGDAEDEFDAFCYRGTM